MGAPMRKHRYERKEFVYTFFELNNAVRVVRHDGTSEYEHTFSIGDKVNDRTLKQFSWDSAFENGHSVYASSTEFPSSNSQSLARQIDLIIDNNEAEERDITREIEIISGESSLSDTEKEALIKIRKGQAKFRKMLLNMWTKCAVTGCETKDLLVASHIIPWTKSIEDRLNPYNGLLLIANLDRAFDSGLISFDKLGKILISSELKKEDRQLAGIRDDMRIDLHPNHEKFLRHHREVIFKTSA